MEGLSMDCTLITPLFSHGADFNYAELRATELKGAMRNTYRMICSSDTKTMWRDEAELFGGANFSGGAGHMSPIRLILSGNMSCAQKQLLLHDKRKQEKPKGCFEKGTFKITAYFNPYILNHTEIAGIFKQVNLEWYGDLIELSLLMCGMGLRSRKGRGCFQTSRTMFKGKNEFLNWLCSVLNNVHNIAANTAAVPNYKTSIYCMTDDKKGEIISTSLRKLKRPFIQRIKLGDRLKKETQSYLKIVDEMCHDLKAGELKSAADPNESLDQYITGYATEKEKFASPLLMRIIKTAEGCYPLYIFIYGITKEKDINGITKEKVVDKDCSQRRQFVEMLEQRKKVMNA